MSNKSNNVENKRIGALLKYARETHNLKQADMTDVTGLTKNHISALERGANKPSIELLLGYCNKIGITPNDILGYTDSRLIDAELQIELMKMSDEEQRKVLEIIKIIKYK